MKGVTLVNRDHAIGFGVGILTGAVIGGVIALLYAPKTGKETRQIIKDKAVDVGEAVKFKTIEVVDAVKDAASEANRKGQAVVHALKS
jgi:gas vesicle protein